MSDDDRILGEVLATVKVLACDMQEVKRDVRLLLDGKAAVCERHDREIADVKREMNGVKRAILWLVLTLGGAGAGAAKWLSGIIP